MNKEDRINCEEVIAMIEALKYQNLSICDSAASLIESLWIELSWRRPSNAIFLNKEGTND